MRSGGLEVGRVEGAIVQIERVREKIEKSEKIHPSFRQKQAGRAGPIQVDTRSIPAPNLLDASSPNSSPNPCIFPGLIACIPNSPTCA
jgi:hypothetical protein